MVKINLQCLRGSIYNFLIATENRGYTTSSSIANLFNLNLDTYNEILVKEVIKHPCFESRNFMKFPFLGVESNKDIVFYLNDIDEEVYIERFKNVFAKQLTLLKLGGI